MEEDSEIGSTSLLGASSESTIRRNYDVRYDGPNSSDEEDVQTENETTDEDFGDFEYAVLNDEAVKEDVLLADDCQKSENEECILNSTSATDVFTFAPEFTDPMVDIQSVTKEEIPQPVRIAPLSEGDKSVSSPFLLLWLVFFSEQVTVIKESMKKITMPRREGLGK